MQGKEIRRLYMYTEWVSEERGHAYMYMYMHKYMYVEGIQLLLQLINYRQEGTLVYMYMYKYQKFTCLPLPPSPHTKEEMTC